MIYLDTHVVVWLYAGLVDRFGQDVRNLINENDVYISPIVRLELQYLSEVQRVMVDAGVVVTDLSKRLGLRVCDKGFDPIVNQAMTLSWTRDPFDRLIVANAALDDNLLVSKDQNILAHYPRATWQNGKFTAFCAQYDGDQIWRIVATARADHDLVLMRAGYPLAVIARVNRWQCYRVLSRADVGNPGQLVNFVETIVEHGLMPYLEACTPQQESPAT